MKKLKSLQESQGMIDKDGVQWNDLCDLITNYIYDLQDGLNADPDYNGNDGTITKGNIESYYQYKHSKRPPKYLIPDWIGTFRILIVNEKGSKGSFIRRTAYLNDNNTLVFEIELNPKISPDEANNTLVHEFQHAYSYWLEESKGISFYTNKSANLYRHALKGFSDPKYKGETQIPAVMQKFSDLLEINDEVFENPVYLERMLLTSFYYANLGEIRSFIQEFANDIMKQIRNNIDTVKKEIKQSLEFKGDFNKLNKVDQLNSNILNNLSISCYDSVYYNNYKAFYELFNKILKMNIEEDVAQEAVKSTSMAIRTFLNISPTKKLIQFDGDANEILKKIARKQIPVYENVIKKMQKIFVKLIMEIPIK